jgi:DNA repair photolyase
MKNVSLKTYYGGFLLNGIAPLELDLNWCSHRCRGCFSNLNEPDRRGNPQQVLGTLAKARTNSTLEGHLIRNRYPVAFSNHVDPFATANTNVKNDSDGMGSNWTMPILEAMVDMDLPIYILTKGGRGLDKPFNYHCSALDILPVPTVFYVSVETLDNDISRLWAPAAPVASRRLELIETLASKGHIVVVGINPTVPDWIPDPAEMVSTLARLGVKGLWVNPLHLSNKQKQRMPAADKIALGERLMDMAKLSNRSKYPEIDETLDAIRDAAAGCGLPVYEGQQGRPCTFFDIYDFYPNRYPTIQDFVNWCWGNLHDGDLIYWETFRDLLLPKLPEGVWPIGQHIGAMCSVAFWGTVKRHTARFRHKYGSANRMTYEDLLRLIWGYYTSVYCPANLPCFSWAVSREPSNPDRGNTDGVRKLKSKSDTLEMVLDDEGLPVLVFSKQPPYTFSKKLPLYTEV